MSKPRYRWRRDARAVIREYPALKRRAAELQATSITQQYGAMPGAHQVSRTTETAALRELPREEQRKLDAVTYAIHTTMRYRNGDLRLRLVELIYWRGTHTLSGASVQLHVSIDTAKHWHSDFVELVDAYLRVL